MKQRHPTLALWVRDVLSLRLSFFTDENITRAHLGHTDTQTLAAKSNTTSAMCLCGSLVVEHLTRAKEAERDLVSMCGLTSTDIYIYIYGPVC